jgi:hypothetical protein
MAKFLTPAIAVKDHGDKILAKKFRPIPEGTDTVPGTAVSGTAENIAAARTPKEQRLIFAGRALAGMLQTGFPGNCCPFRLAVLRLNKSMQLLERGRRNSVGTGKIQRQKYDDCPNISLHGQ